MQTKSLLYGLVGFMLGGLLVSIAALTFEKPTDNNMASMSSSLEGKIGDDFDKEFVSQMIIHHQGAIDMASRAASQAKHQEIKDLSEDIIDAQQSEITQMRQWQMKWGYSHSMTMHDGM
jgi:predicted outer membrane protein